LTSRGHTSSKESFSPFLYIIFVFVTLEEKLDRLH
jgi:hypothetical protein